MQFDRRNMVEDFRLVLHHLTGQAIYTVPGEVTGNVVVVTVKPKLYDAITVTLRGDADAYFHAVGDDYVQSHEEIICKTIVLWIPEHVSNSVLNPGEYVFPFKFTLQPLSGRRFPSSFSGSNGHIRYEVAAKIVSNARHFPLRDKTVSAIIKVVNRVPVDINKPALMSPFRSEIEKTDCCQCCISGAIHLTVNMPRRGFNIGECIPITTSLDNGSRRAITLRATIVQTATYRARESTLTDPQEVYSLLSPQVPGRTTYRWTPADQIVITEAALPTINNCGIINLQYSLKIEAIIPWATNAVINIPITLSNVPQQSLERQQSHPPTQHASLLSSDAPPPYELVINSTQTYTSV